MKRFLSKVTTKYQAVIPKEVRKIMNLKVGDYIVYEVTADETIILKKGKIKIETED
jgi:AbrB family looped-hinge helix DNA binding protein